MNLILGLFTFILVLISIFMVLVILAQRAKSDGGVGAALGGGMTEAAFGADSGNVLSRATTYAAIAFFVIAFGLYLGFIHLHRAEQAERPAGLPSSPDLIATPESTAPDEPAALDIPSVTFPTAEDAKTKAKASADEVSEELPKEADAGAVPQTTPAP